MSLLQAVITALLSGLFSGAIIFALNERRDRTRFTIEKIEETILTYSELGNELTRWPRMHFRLFYDSDSDPNKDIDDLWRNIERLESKSRMLIAVYFPREIGVYLDLVSAYQPFIEVGRDMQICAIKETGAVKGSEDLVFSTIQSIVNAHREGERRLFDVARAHAHSQFLIRLPRVKLRGWNRS